jgi:aminoglycoside phosphotransferase (APT) family kinase protein
MNRFAADLAGFLAALHRVGAEDGPPPGKHNFFRGGPLTVYDAETRAAIETLGDRIDGAAATRVWEAALAATWDGAPVWVHGDVAEGNLLVADGALSAVIDFGGTGVGDPSCDTVIAWTFFSGPSRETFRAALPVDAGTWARGRGWALWKALIVLAREDTLKTRHVIGEVLADHEAVCGSRLSLLSWLLGSITLSGGRCIHWVSPARSGWRCRPENPSAIGSGSWKAGWSTRSSWAAPGCC